MILLIALFQKGALVIIGWIQKDFIHAFFILNPAVHDLIRAMKVVVIDTILSNRCSYSDYG